MKVAGLTQGGAVVNAEACWTFRCAYAVCLHGRDVNASPKQQTAVPYVLCSYPYLICCALLCLRLSAGCDWIIQLCYIGSCQTGGSDFTKALQLSSVEVPPVRKVLPPALLLS